MLLTLSVIVSHLSSSSAGAPLVILVSRRKKTRCRCFLNFMFFTFLILLRNPQLFEALMSTVSLPSWQNPTSPFTSGVTRGTELSRSPLHAGRRPGGTGQNSHLGVEARENVNSHTKNPQRQLKLFFSFPHKRELNLSTAIAV